MLRFGRSPRFFGLGMVVFLWASTTAHAQEEDASTNPLRLPEQDYLAWVSETALELSGYFKALEAAKSEMLAAGLKELPPNMGVVAQEGGWVFHFGELDRTSRFFVSHEVRVDSNGSVRDLISKNPAVEDINVASLTARALANAVSDHPKRAHEMGIDPAQYRFALLPDGDYFRVFVGPKSDGPIEDVVFGGDLMYTYIALTAQLVGRSPFHRRFQEVNMVSEAGKVANFTGADDGMPSPFDVLNAWDFRVPVTVMSGPKIYYIHATGKVESLPDDHPMMRGYQRARQEMMDRMRRN